MFYQIFNIYPHEKQKVLFFALLGLFFSIGTSSGYILADGLFLENIGANALPTAYIALAFSLLVFSSLLLCIMGRVSMNKLFFYFMLITTIFYLAIPFLLTHFSSSPFVWYLFKIMANLLYTTLTTCFWSFIDQYFGLQLAKRIYCLYAAAIFVGVIVSGLLISILLRRDNFFNIFILIAVAFAVCLVCIQFISYKEKIVEDEHTAQINYKLSFTAIVRATLQSKFTFFFLIGNIIIYMLSVVTEFNYMLDISKTFTTSHNLTVFLGQMNIGIYSGNIIFGTLLYSRILARFGLNNLILLIPLCFLGIFTGWLFMGGLVMGILVFSLTEGMLTTVDDNNFNLLLNAVPVKIKNKVRAASECFLEPVGMLLCSLLLVSFQKESKLIGLVLSFVLLVATLLMRASYVRGILSNLKEHTINFNFSLNSWLKRLTQKDKDKATFNLLSNLKKTDTNAQIFALKSLLTLNDPKHMTFLLRFLNQLTLPAKHHAIKLIEETDFSENPLIIRLLQRWGKTYPSLKSPLLFFFARKDLLSVEEAQIMIQDPDLYVHAAGILVLLRHSYLSGPQEHYLLAKKELYTLLRSQDDKKLALALKILALLKQTETAEIVLPFIKHKSEMVYKAALKSLSALVDNNTHHFASIILDHITKTIDTKTRIHCLRHFHTLSTPSFIKDLIVACHHFRTTECRYVEEMLLKKGSGIANFLFRLMQDTHLPDKSRLVCARVLGNLPTKSFRLFFLA